MTDMGTTQAVQNYLDELGRVPADAPAEPVVRALLARSVARLHMLCASLLHRQYPRLTRGPLNLQSEELLGAVVERLIKAMRSVRPQGVRQFFALANQHMRWELNDLARRLDEQRAAVVPMETSFAIDASAGPPTDGQSATGASPGGQVTQRVLAAIERLPEDEREVLNLVQIQGLTHAEAAAVIGVSTRTVQRRINRCLLLLSEQLGDLAPPIGAVEAVGDGQDQANV